MPNRTLRLKAFLRPLHTWTGIVAGVFLSIVALTGSLIVFRGEFERSSYPAGAEAAGSRWPISVDDAALSAMRARPGSRVRRMRFPQRPGDPYVAQVESEGKRTERILVDSATGRVLGALDTGTIDWFIDLHRNFLAGKRGRAAVGGAGVVLFLLSATGILMWLAGSVNWRAWISVRGSGSRWRFHFELHRAAGLWAYAFLAVISFTGIELAYPDSFRSAVRSLTGQPVTIAAPKVAAVASLRPLDEYVHAGKSAMPDGTPIELRLPAAGGKGAVDLRFYRSGDLAPSGNHVYLDPASGNILRVDRIVDRPIGARFLAALSPIHYGEFGGIPIKIAWALMGLSPVLLFVTGLYAWRRPSKKAAAPTAPDKSGRADLAMARR